MNTPLRTLKAKARAVVQALYALERRFMIPLPFIVGVPALVVAALCLILALILRPGGAGLPFRENFDGEGAESWPGFGGAWAVHGGALVQSDADSDAGKASPLQIGAGQPYQYHARLRRLDGDMGGGLLFNAQQSGSRAQSHVARFNVETNVLYALYGYYDDAGTFNPQGSAPLALRADSADWRRLGVWVGPERYHVLVNGQVVAANIPLHYRGGAVGVVASASQVAFDDLEADRWEPGGAPVEVAPTPAPVLVGQVRTASEIGALLFSDSFEVEDETLWHPFSGDWEVVPGVFVQRQPDGFDHGVSHRDTFESFVLRATFAHRQGAGGGVLFNMPHRDTVKGAHIVRYFGSDAALAWGYFDENGAFTPQGTAAVPPAGADSHTLEVRADLGAYTVSLDGALVATDAPLVSQSGHIGLTSSESAVAFASVEVYALGDEEESTTTMELSAISGTWIGAEGILAQLSSAPADFLAGAGLSATTFRLSVDVSLPTDPALGDASGGLVFHMAGRDNWSGGHVVRFTSGGQEVIWGLFDAGDGFKELGRAPLGLKPGGAHTLALIVRTDNYDILADGDLVVSSLLLQSSSGWLGLTSFRGPVSFSNFRLTLGESES